MKSFCRNFEDGNMIMESIRSTSTDSIGTTEENNITLQFLTGAMSRSILKHLL